MPPRYTIRQVVGTYRRKAFGTKNADGTPRRPAYPPDAIVAFYGTLELAEEQPTRGHFESERLLRLLLEGPKGLGRRFARQVPFLIEQRDLVRTADGGLDVDGWRLLQEGTETVHERVARLNARREDGVEAPLPPTGVRTEPLTGAQRTALWRLKQRVFKRDLWTCRYCGIDDYPREWLIAEHVIPEAQGGPTTEENLVTACRSCNRRKGGLTPDEVGMPLLPIRGQSGVTRDVTRDVTGPDDPRAGDARVQRRGFGGRHSADGGGDDSLPETRELVHVGDVLPAALRATTSTTNGNHR